jgi:hypothetical protein
MQRRIIVGVAVAGAVLACVDSAQAIPAFARRYDVECHFCHDGYPKLNAMGQRFRERGFRMEQEAEFDAARWLTGVPLALRASGGRRLNEERDDSSFGYLKGISAGNLGSRLSYWVDDALLITEGDDNVHHVEPDNAWLRFEVVREGKLYLKAGRLELELPFTQTRTPHLFSYDIYFANAGFESDDIGSYQEGVEVGGELPGDARWSAAVVRGRNSESAELLSDEADDFDGNLFLRAAKRIQRHRIGAFAYIGRNTLALRLPPPFGRGPERVLVWDDDILRLGADASVWIQRLNLYGVYMYGRNDNPIATLESPSGTRQRLTFSGGFAQADLHVNDKMALTLRLNAVERPPGNASGPKRTLTSVFPGVQLWALARIKLSAEYGFHDEDRSNFGAVQLEVAF